MMTKSFKNSFFYLGLLGVFSLLMVGIIRMGSALEVGRPIVYADSSTSAWNDFLAAMQHNLEHPLALLLAQITLIILTARFFGWIFRRIGQPTVIGEILAGIALGPSLLGMYFPGFSSALFPIASLGNLQFLSQIGLILFMFVIGMELDLKVLKNKAHDAVVISHASIVFPFALGMLLAYFIYESFAPASTPFVSFGLFLGIAMSITAFPVLARIVQERGMHKTRIGTVAITCAAADDITAWCLLAAVIAIVKAGNWVSSLYTMILAALYVVWMIKAVRPFLKRVGDLYSSRESLSKPIVAIFFIQLLLSSYATEVIGIHALFGAFMAGAIMPESAKFRSLFIEKVEDVSLVLLLPLFFVFTGLRTQIGLLNEPYLWAVTGLIILVAVLGKFMGSALTARFVGQTWKDSLSIGALMNTRGLMELVVLNIGYDLGVLTPEIFAMMVIMALVTTFMTGPALDLIEWLFRPRKTAPPAVRDLSRYKVLISFGNPERGRSLLRLAHSFIKKMNDHASITTMHLSPSNELNPHNTSEYEQESFAPVREESLHLKQKVTILFKASNDIDADIAAVANSGEYDLLLVGVGQSIYEGSLLGKILGFTTRFIHPDHIINKVTGKEKLFEQSPFDDRTQAILSNSVIPVGVLMDKNFTAADVVFIPIFSENDAFLIHYAQRLIHNNGSQISILDVGEIVKKNAAIKEAIRAIEQTAPNHIRLITERTLDKDFLQRQQLMLISVESWKQLVETKSIWLSDVPSTLIISEAAAVA